MISTAVRHVQSVQALLVLNNAHSMPVQPQYCKIQHMSQHSQADAVATHMYAWQLTHEILEHFEPRDQGIKGISCTHELWMIWMESIQIRCMYIHL